MTLKEQAQKLKSDIPAIFLSLKDKNTPFPAKLFGVITVVYALSPVDFIPDFVPVLGYLDDVILLPLLVALTIRFIPDNMLEHYRTQSAGMWENGKPKKWYYAVPIVLFWTIVICWILGIFL